MVFENTIQPLLFMLGWGGILESGYVAAGWLLVGMLQIAVICLVLGPLQKWKPVEPVVNKAAVRVDVLYTLIHRLGCSVSQSFSADTSHGLDVWCASPHWLQSIAARWFASRSHGYSLG